MLMRGGQLNKALQLIDELEQHVESSANIFPPSLSYMVPFLRGIAHLQAGAPKAARTELEAALASTREDEEATVRVRNFLGIAFLMLDLPQHALEQHLVCWQSIRNLVTKDHNLYVSVSRNLANDYSALNEPDRAIDLYEEMLPAMQDLNDLEQQAEALCKIAIAYEANKDWLRAKQYGSWALCIYEAADSRAEAGYFCLKLANIHTSREQYGDALELLNKAERLVMGTGNHAVMSYLHRAYADLARRQGDYERGIQHAKQSIALAQSYKEATQSDDSRANVLSRQDPTSLYAEALHIAALIEEDQGNKEAADRLFEQALALLHTGGFEEVRHALNLSYAIVLQARGDLEKAVSFYRRAAELQTLTMPRQI
jgi:tetratricopeptide (TPR) repeat protein